MTVLVDRITAVLRQHSANRCWWKCDGGTYWTEGDHAAHVAERVAEALQPDVDVVAKTMFEDTHGFPSWHELSEDDQGLYRALACAALRSVGMEIRLEVA